METIKRILVALDTSTDSVAALHSAANLAGALQVELVGLFVEDTNLLNLAELPFAYAVHHSTGNGQALTKAGMEHDMMLLATQAKQALAEAAERANVAWSFKVVRGTVTNEVVNSALESDLLTLGRASHHLTHQTKLGSTARGVLTQYPHSVMLCRSGSDGSRPVMVLFDGSPAGEKALLASASMADANGCQLTVFLITQKYSEAELNGQVSRLLAERRFTPSITFQTLGDLARPGLIQIAQEAQCSLLVLGGDSQLLEGSALQNLLDELYCPVMVIR